MRETTIFWFLLVKRSLREGQEEVKEDPTNFNDFKVGIREFEGKLDQMIS